MKSMRSILEIENLSKRYYIGASKSGTGKNQAAWIRNFYKVLGLETLSTNHRREFFALKDITFQVSQGEILGIIGTNGAGKTTLLKIIARVIFPTAGYVRGHGKVIPLLELGTGFQPDLSARENIYLTAALYGVAQSRVREKFDHIVDFAEIGKFVDMPLRQFSTGMYVRLAFSLAINLEPDILLADEVLAVGDHQFQERCLERVADAGQRGMTVLFVSHDMSAITRLCTRVIHLHAGRIKRIGNPSQVVLAYERNVDNSPVTDECLDMAGCQNDYGKLLGVKLLSAEGREIGAVRVDEEILLALYYHAMQPPGKIRCAFDVYTKGILAFRTVQPHPVQIDANGIYIAHVRIPSHLFSETFYTINASITFLDHSDIQPLVQHRALSFQVYDVNPLESARGTYEGSLKGVVSPKLEWQLKALNNIVPSA